MAKQLRKTIYILAVMINLTQAVVWVPVIFALLLGDSQNGSLLGDVMLLSVPAGSVFAVIALLWKPWEMSSATPTG